MLRLSTGLEAPSLAKYDYNLAALGVPTPSSFSKDQRPILVVILASVYVPYFTKAPSNP